MLKDFTTVHYVYISLYSTKGHVICGPWELQHGANYVAVGYHEKFIKHNYNNK